MPSLGLAARPHEPQRSPPGLPLSDVSLGPVVMADDPCEAAFSAEDPTGPRNYYRARYFEPKLGRFLSEDPIGFAGGVNFYNYVLNDPVNLTDPFGLDVDVCFYSDAAFGFGHMGFGLPMRTRHDRLLLEERQTLWPRRDQARRTEICSPLRRAHGFRNDALRAAGFR